MRRISIVGLGLIGGSLGLALKKALGPDIEITGCARRPEIARQALHTKAVDSAVTDLPSAVKNAEMVIVATPALSIKDIFKQMAPALPNGCIVTDAASTKSMVLEWADKYLPPGVNFVGGHPMAGKETSGIAVAEAGLFQGCTWCICPSQAASRESLYRVKWIAESVGAKPMYLNAADHDYMVAGISHLPLLISSALVSAAAGNEKWTAMSQLASTGFRDVTRLASGSPEMGRDICLTNKESLVRWIDSYIDELRRYRELVSQGDPQIEKALSEARDARNRWMAERFGQK